MTGAERQCCVAGFTLLELLITLAIISILAVISMVSYSQYSIRANRADAKIALTQLAQQEERYFSTHQAYLSGKLGKDPMEEFGRKDRLSDKGLYELSITTKNPNDSGYLIMATASKKGSQFARDPKCRTFTLDHTGKEGASSADGVETTAECWGR